MIKFTPIADKEIRIKPEFSLGSIISIFLIIIGAMGIAYSTIADVKTLKRQVDEKASRDLVEQVSQDINSLRKDVTTLNLLIVQHLQNDQALSYNHTKMDSLRAIENRLVAQLKSLQ
jgi:hypothetical protein